MAQKVIRSHNTIQLQRQMLRGRITDRFLVVFVIAVVFLGFVFGGKYIGLAKYSEAVTGVFGRNDSTPTPVETDEGTFVPSDSISGGASTPATSPGGPTSVSPDPAPGSSSSSTSAVQPNIPANPASPTSACGNVQIPEGACTAMLNIEQNGPKNNQYVTMDTTSIPQGSTVVINKATWANTSNVAGSVEFTINIYNQPYKGLLNMQLNGNTWQAVNYTTR